MFDFSRYVNTCIKLKVSILLISCVIQVHCFDDACDNSIYCIKKNISSNLELPCCIVVLGFF